MSDDDTTRIITRKQNQTPDELTSTTPIQGQGWERKIPVHEEDSDTKIFRPSSDKSSTSSESNKDGKFSKEPVVGWLVIVSGPGRGQSLQLGYGMNSIGRNQDQRISLDFGDEEISRENHALLTYDTKGKKFYLQHGGGVNLTYVGETPVLQILELKGREVISIGKTNLCFIPFCGPEFEWH
jgi:hypothetical protein